MLLQFLCVSIVFLVDVTKCLRETTSGEGLFMLAPGFRGVSQYSRRDSDKEEESFSGQEAEKENTRRSQGKISLSRTQPNDPLLLQPLTPSPMPVMPEYYKSIKGLNICRCRVLPPARLSVKTNSQPTRRFESGNIVPTFISSSQFLQGITFILHVSIKQINRQKNTRFLSELCFISFLWGALSSHISIISKTL